MSDALTRGVRVTVSSFYVEERSSPEDDFYYFAYHVEIANEGDEVVKLVSRHWIITDGTGKVQEVKGPGVVGAQPVLRPSERFEYTSACPLTTQVGVMHGTYQLVTEEGETFDARIEAFTLACPNAIN